MSAVASAYKMEANALARASTLIAHNEYDKLWDLMKIHRVATLSYSGIVLAAAIPFLGERGIAFPKREDLSVFSTRDRETIGLIALGNADDYTFAARDLASLSVTNDELRQYYMQLYGDEWDQAATAMREAFSFLGRAMKSVEFSQDLLLIAIH